MTIKEKNEIKMNKKIYKDIFLGLVVLFVLGIIAMTIYKLIDCKHQRYKIKQHVMSEYKKEKVKKFKELNKVVCKGKILNNFKMINSNGEVYIYIGELKNLKDAYKIKECYSIEELK